MSADSPRRTTRGVPAVVPPQIVSDRSIIDSVAGFINDVALTNQPQGDPKDTITWARFEQSADISDPTFGDDWEIDGNVAPPLLLILGYGLGIQVWAIPANGEAVEVLSWRHGHVTTLRVLPTPLSSDDEMADDPIDNYADKRPLMAICDGSTPNNSTQTYCSVNFISLKTGSQVKTIKFKNNVLDILANRTSIIITFPERIAVFDARTLDDRLSVTTCYPSPGINPNPVALGSRWMAYSESKLLHSKRSGGGCYGDGVSSYTATVLNAAKSLGKGLRELGEQVAAGLTGTSSGGMSSKGNSFDSAGGDLKQTGVVTILDIKNPIKDVSPTTGTPVSINGADPVIAHFIAHSEAIVSMEFDFSGMLLLTADKRGHDFHLFRIQPHPAGSHLAAVHHLYILHRGDTSAKVQNITFALDSRWVAVSTLRGTTHVFPVTPYGGSYGVRTHASLHVVNKLSRFHRSAGLSADNRSSSPISHSESMSFNQISMPYHNPTMPPYPRPHIILPLAQLRQPSVLGSPPGSAQNLSYQKSIGSGISGNSSVGRQRLSSLSDDNGKPLSVCAVFAKARSWLLDPPNAAREGPAHKLQRKPIDSLFIMAGHGALIQYDLDTKLASNVAKEKICDDTPIVLDVEAKAQWNLGRKESSMEIQPPLTSDNWLVKDRSTCVSMEHHTQYDDCDERNDRWLSQVEIITHAGPHRRLWMGPQFVFKTYNTPSGSNLSHIDTEAIEIGVTPSSGSGSRPPGRSSPMNMPLASSGRSAVPVLIESGSYSSIEQSPKLMDRFKHEHLDSDFTLAHGETRLKEDLADAMRESPSVQHKDTGLLPTTGRKFRLSSSKTIVDNSSSNKPITSITANISSNNSSIILQEHDPESCISIEKIVNPLGTVTTITRSPSEIDFDINNIYDTEDRIIHENCDESLFRPVVTIFCDEKTTEIIDSNNKSKLKNKNNKLDKDKNNDYEKPPESIGTKLIVPVIEKSIKINKDENFSKIKNNDKKFNEKNDELNISGGTIKRELKKTSKNINKITSKLEEKNEDISTFENKNIKNDNVCSNTGAINKIKSQKSLDKDKIMVSSNYKETDFKDLTEKQKIDNNKKTSDNKSRKSVERDTEKSIVKKNLKTDNNRKLSISESTKENINISKSKDTTSNKIEKKENIENKKSIEKYEEIESDRNKKKNKDERTAEDIKQNNKIKDNTKKNSSKLINKNSEQETFIIKNEPKKEESDNENYTTTCSRIQDDETTNIHTKSSKDDDSESFESLENMEDNYEFEKFNIKTIDITYNPSNSVETKEADSESPQDFETIDKNSLTTSPSYSSVSRPDNTINFEDASKDNEPIDTSSNFTEFTVKLSKKSKKEQPKPKPEKQSFAELLKNSLHEDDNKKIEIENPIKEIKPTKKSGKQKDGNSKPIKIDLYETELIDSISIKSKEFELESMLEDDNCIINEVKIKPIKKNDKQKENSKLVETELPMAWCKSIPVTSKDFVLDSMLDDDNYIAINEIKIKPTKKNEKQKEDIKLIETEQSAWCKPLTIKSKDFVLDNMLDDNKYNVKQKSDNSTREIKVNQKSGKQKQTYKLEESVDFKDKIYESEITVLEDDLKFNKNSTSKNSDNSKQSKQKGNKIKDLTSLSFPDLPPLAPLEPFDAKFDFEPYEFKTEKQDNHFSLINFESPKEENSSNDNLKKLDKTNCVETKSKDNDVNPSDNHEEDLSNDSVCKNVDSITTKSEDTFIQPSEIIIAPKRKNRKKDKNSNTNNNVLEIPVVSSTITTSTSSSEETEESSSSTFNLFEHKNKKIIDDDEELRPLIDASNMACSMTMSITDANSAMSQSTTSTTTTTSTTHKSNKRANKKSNKKIGDDSNSDETSPTSTDIALEIIESLPNNNQSDSSSDQAKTSEEQGSTEIDGGSQSALANIDTEEMSSSSVSSASRVSLDPPSSSPTNSGENFLHFPGDSSGSL